MSTQLNPYLSFRGQAREAMTFYQSVLGGQLDVTTYGDMGGFEQMGITASEADNVMHSSLGVSDSVQLMGSDVPAHMEGDFSNGRISLSGDDEATLRRWFDALADGGTVHVPLEKAPWGDSFGDLTDRYGVGWMVNVAGGGPA
ncbi:VOC family protein [Nocardioides sp. YIM 152315]|uniref:VOC family protein n=1 Tax=Nocardioides sp. YIM 152315 TaxID=3031760 RepID=UPI0023DA9CA8|nr:VOC family protein [Nocardioides sp. YIM 152315]MDF1602085.1 VOC family protein [Nocardioides sp. YIM 152315]